MEVFRAAVERFVFGHIHMWFLQILCGFYLLIPVARQISAKRNIAVLPDSVDHIPVPDTDCDGCFWPDHVSGAD